MLAYEELQGSRGRAVWVRAPRYDARKLFPNVPPRVNVGSAFYKLHNISLGGLAVVCNHSAENIPDVNTDRTPKRRLRSTRRDRPRHGVDWRERVTAFGRRQTGSAGR